MNHQVLARKWRPKNFDQIIGQVHVVQALSNALDQNYLHHAYLLTGTRGVGKTTIARIIAKCLNCEKGIRAKPCDQCSSCQEIDAGRFVDLFEIDAASRTKVEDTRDLLDNVQYKPTKGRFKVYLIDEVHMLSGHSFNALLKTLEEPPAHVKFILATTDHQRLPATVLSRCLQFHLKQMAPQQIAGHLQNILTQENVAFETDATLLIGKAANGSMRDALSLLDQGIAFGNGKVMTADIKTMLGTIEPTALYQILTALADQDANTLLSSAANLADQGADFAQALADLLSLLHQIAVIQVAPQSETIEENSQPLQALAERFNQEDVQLHYQIGLLGQRDLSMAPTPRSGFEMTLLRMLAFIPQQVSEQPGTRNPSSMPSQNFKTHSQSKSQPTSQSAISTSTSATATTSAATISATDEWNQLLPLLKLTGATNALAQHCSLKNRTDSHFHLILSPKQKPLLHAKHIQRMNEALSQHFNKPMTVTIDIDINFDNSNVETPASFMEHQKETQAMAAEQAILKDPNVQQIINTFDARLIKDSVSAAEPLTN